ncbi:zinc transporter 2 isoform 2 [Tropilaelaps mercedesae]|uniref:Zinc transporter 2 isoform 2 n=1 Tax=Tropilaelaps mercedesae TaxID=418985 RepID=A0A1V9XAY6_9ACAR|nr:zinc transporter 2 isoform 2 [Tropilaelaps mercedesae]
MEDSDRKKLTEDVELDPDAQSSGDEGSRLRTPNHHRYRKLQDEQDTNEGQEPPQDGPMGAVEDSTPLEVDLSEMVRATVGGKLSHPEGTPLTTQERPERKKRQHYSTIETTKCIHGRRDCTCKLNDTVVKYQEFSDSSGSDHCHVETGVGTNASAKRKLIIASILCLLFMLIECVGGILANSLAIATDAAHLLTDFASFMISLFALWISARPASKRMSYGWHRAEVIGALTSVLLIWVVTGILVYLAVERIVYDNYEIQSIYMVISASIGVAVNIIMGCSLHYGGLPHGHSHGGSGGHGHFEGKVEPDAPVVSDVEEGRAAPHRHNSAAHTHDPNSNINVRAALIHVIGDFLQSLGVLVAAFVIHFWPDMRIVDPICTFVFSVLVLITTVAILKETIVVLMEGKPKGIDFGEVRELLTAVRGVKHVHNLRIWALTLEKTVLSTHVGIEVGTTDYHRVQKECVRKLREKYAFFEVTVQVEEWNPNMQDCVKCNDISD